VLKRVKDALIGSGCGFAKIKFHKNQQMPRIVAVMSGLISFDQGRKSL